MPYANAITLFMMFLLFKNSLPNHAHSTERIAGALRIFQFEITRRDSGAGEKGFAQSRAFTTQVNVERSHFSGEDRESFSNDYDSGKVPQRCAAIAANFESKWWSGSKGEKKFRSWRGSWGFIASCCTTGNGALRRAARAWAARLFAFLSWSGRSPIST